MKRLLDESTDELTRSLLEAGIEHRPPPGNERRLIVALGAGSALGLFSSNAFAWLGTTAGKVTAAGVAVGVAGAVLVAGPLLKPSDDGVERSGAGRSNGEAIAALAHTPEPERAAPAARAGAEDGVAAASPEPGVAAEPLDEALGGASERDSSVRGSSSRSAGAEQRGAGSKARKGAVKGASAKAKKASARKARAASAKPKQSEKAVAPAAAAAQMAPEARRAALDAEVRMVDDMHRAARRDDRAALARLVAAYHAEFPAGQLRAEVADFEADLEQLP